MATLRGRFAWVVAIIRSSQQSVATDYWLPAVDAEGEVAGGALAHVGVPVYHRGALTGQPGADHHVHL